MPRFAPQEILLTLIVFSRPQRKRVEVWLFACHSFFFRPHLSIGLIMISYFREEKKKGPNWLSELASSSSTFFYTYTTNYLSDLVPLAHGTGCPELSQITDTCKSKQSKFRSILELKAKTILIVGPDGDGELVWSSQNNWCNICLNKIIVWTNLRMFSNYIPSWSPFLNCF